MHEKNKMKKIYSVGSDTRSSENSDVTRRWYRNLNEISKKLDEQKSRALSAIDLFTPTGEALRSKLRDYCERLIINDPINYVQKTDELLWRKGFYDIVSAAKKLRKGNTWNEAEKAFLSAHLSVGVGFYHHLILRLQLEYDLKLTGVIDFAYPQNPCNENRTLFMDRSQNTSRVHSTDTQKCVTRIIHRSLICLGDLSRYQLDLDPNWDPQIATRYYKIAVTLDSKYGMPYNQLGTVANNKNYGLDAVYNYMRSILCEEPFERAEGNLKRTIVIHSLSGKEKCLTHFCVARLFLLLQLWDNNAMNTDQINQESHALLSDIENCLNVEKSENFDYKAAENEDSIEKYLSHFKSEEITYLTDEMIFKIIVICLMKILKIQIKESNEAHDVVAFVLAIFSQILQFVVIRLQESLLDMSQLTKISNIQKKSESLDENDEKNDLKNLINEKNICGINKQKSCDKVELNGNHINEKKNKTRAKPSLLTKFRRPRNRKYSSDSDASDGEGTALGSSTEDINSDISETEENGVSDEVTLSDEALSEDLSDDDDFSKQKDVDTSEKETKLKNGHEEVQEKFVEENENNDDIKINGKLQSEEKNDSVKMNSNNTYDELKTANVLAHVAQKEKQNLDPIKVLKVLNDEKILTSIKVCCDWLQSNQDVIKNCAKGLKSLLKRLVTLLNLINLDLDNLLNKSTKSFEIFSSLEKIEAAISIIPLPEDLDLKGLKIFEDAHKNIDWDILKRKKITNSEETLLRALKIVKFGHHLCLIPESGVTYDKSKNLFVIKDEGESVKGNQEECKNFDLDTSKGKLMRHMGKLWLKAEVRALESRLHQRLMSPYLVPDHEAFSSYMPVLKNLAYAKKFILVIPSVVISALDEMKKTSSQAREATRWLENQLQRGSRFLRAQRPHEKLPLPLIKGPKPKDKEAWLYFQIIECSHYLTQQSKSGATEIPVVTLLTGTDMKKLSSFGLEGLAKTAGVNFEHIGAFHAKWKMSIKSHG